MDNGDVLQTGQFADASAGYAQGMLHTMYVGISVLDCGYFLHLVLHAPADAVWKNCVQ